jgi:hydroxymethylglutaryl-CoA synthase
VRPNADESTLDYMDRAVYHNPHKKMVISAYASLLMHEWRNLTRWREVVAEIGEEPSRAGMDDFTFYMGEPYKQYRRNFMKSAQVMNSFEKHIGSSLLAPDLIGNAYSVSVFVGLDSLLENDKEDLAGKRVVMFGYGSGSHAVIQGNSVPEGYKEFVRQLDLMRRLDTRRKLSIEEYERIHRGEVEPSDWAVGSRKQFVLSSIGARETPSEGDREYTLAE